MTRSNTWKKYKKFGCQFLLFLLIAISISLGIYCFLYDNSSNKDGPIVLITAISVVTIIIGYYLNAENDREAKRTDIRIQYLSEAYKGIALASNRGSEANEFLTALEEAAAIIQLYGEEDEIKVIRETILILDGKNAQFMSEYRTSGSAAPFSEGVDNVINLLKNRLRELLSLAPYSGRVKQWRGNSRIPFPLPATSNRTCATNASGFRLDHHAFAFGTSAMNSAIA